MRKFSCLFLCTSVLACAVSCSLEDRTDGRVPMARVNFFGRVTEVTKALSGESSVSCLDVLAFRTGTGCLETSSRKTGDVLSIDVPSGVSFTYCVVANAPEHQFDGLTNIDAFNASLTYLEDNVTDLVMFASEVKTFDVDSDLDVELKRYVCKVRLESITPRFMSTIPVSAEVRLTGIFLINVNGTCPLSGIPTAGDLWYNRTESEPLPKEVKEILHRDCDVKITSGERITGPYDFFCCPNPVDNGVTSKTHPYWSVRNTRLVVEITIDGAANYYPVTLPVMDCNCMYLIKNLVLTGPGSDDPDVPVEYSPISFGIEITDWGSNDMTQFFE